MLCCSLSCLLNRDGSVMISLIFSSIALKIHWKEIHLQKSSPRTSFTHIYVNGSATQCFQFLRTWTFLFFWQMKIFHLFRPINVTVRISLWIENPSIPHRGPAHRKIFTFGGFLCVATSDTHILFMYARVQVDKIVMEIGKLFLFFYGTWIMIPDGNESIGPTFQMLENIFRLRNQCCWKSLISWRGYVEIFISASTSDGA